MAKPCGPIIPEDKHNAMCIRHTPKLSKGDSTTADRNRGLAGPLVVDLDFRFPGDVEDH